MTYRNERGGEAVPKPVRRNRNKKFGTDTERRVVKKALALAIPAKRVPLSGAIKGAGLDGDVELGPVLAEIKARTPLETANEKSIRVPLQWWTKVREEAALSGRIPLVWVHPKNSEHDFVLMDDDALLRLVQQAMTQKGDA